MILLCVWRIGENARRGARFRQAGSPCPAGGGQLQSSCQYYKVIPLPRWTMRRRLFLGTTVAALATFALSLVGCGQADDPWKDEPGAPRVVVTIAPLASLVRGVAGDRAAIKCLCTTTGPHHYHLDTRDARVLGQAELFLAVGLRL